MGMQYSRGLVAGYPFENTANDIMGVNNGTVNGAVFVDGQCGRALSFDGVDDYVDCGSNVLLGSAFTVVLRFKFPTGTIPFNNGLFSFKHSSGTNFFTSYLPSIPSYNLFITTLSATGLVRTSMTINRDVWYHIALTYNSGTYAMFINTVNQTLTAMNDFTATSENNKIGTFVTSRNAKVQIDNFQIFNRALTVNEIKRLYLNLAI